MGARVLRFHRHKMRVIQRHSARNFKGRSVILKNGIFLASAKGIVLLLLPEHADLFNLEVTVAELQ